MDTHSIGHESASVNAPVRPGSRRPAKPKSAASAGLKSAGPFVYVGPNLPGGKLSAFTVFRGKPPAHIAALMEEKPEIKRLIVPVAQIAEALQKARTQGTAEFRAVRNLMKGTVN